MNLGVDAARGDFVAVMIDGARMLSPGIVVNFLRARRLFPMLLLPHWVGIWVMSLRIFRCLTVIIRLTKMIFLDLLTGGKMVINLLLIARFHRLKAGFNIESNCFAFT